MTNRDYFAAAALAGIVANEGEGASLAATCEYAYRVADAMLRARARRTAIDHATPSEGGVQSKGTLTDAERAAIEWYAGYGRDGLHADTLRNLLERTK